VTGIRPQQGVHYVTLASETGPGLERYLDSLGSFGVTPHVVWTGSPYPGHLAAMKVLKGHLETRPAAEIVVYTDGFDVVMIRDPADLVARFRAFDAPIVFSTEPGFTYKLPGRYRASRRYPPAGGRSGMYRFLNSGGYIGTAGALTAMLGALRYEAAPDCDQTLINRWFMDHAAAAALDYDQTIFASSACQVGLERRLYRVEDGRLVHTRTGGVPVFFHFPAENRIASARVLDLLPGAHTRLPPRPGERWGVFKNTLETRLPYLLDRPAYPLEDLVGLLLFRVLPATAVVAAAMALWAS